MSKFDTYYARFDGVRGDLTGLPRWARTALVVIVSPAIVLVALSIVAVFVSIAALLFLAVPAYLVLRTLSQTGRTDQADLVEGSDLFSRQAKKVDVIVRNPELQAPDEVNGE